MCMYSCKTLFGFIMNFVNNVLAEEIFVLCYLKALIDLQSAQREQP